jgi:hypothetical protein
MAKDPYRNDVHSRVHINEQAVAAYPEFVEIRSFVVLQEMERTIADHIDLLDDPTGNFRGEARVSYWRSI